MEEEVGSEPAGLRRIDSPLRIANQKRRHRRPAVRVVYVEETETAGSHSEENVDVAPEAEVLRPLADVEGDLRLAVPASRL